MLECIQGIYYGNPRISPVVRPLQHTGQSCITLYKMIFPGPEKMTRPPSPGAETERRYLLQSVNLIISRSQYRHMHMQQETNDIFMLHIILIIKHTKK